MATRRRKRESSVSEETELYIRQLEREVTCQFCLSALDDPRIMECLHVYCRECISGMELKGSPKHYKCPQCAEHLFIEEIDKLPSFNIAKLKKSNLKLLKQISEENTHCEVCPLKKNPQSAVYVCIDCREGKQFLCESCSKSHLHRPEFKDHKMELFSTYVATVTNNHGSHRASTRVSTICDTHGYQLRYFCMTCNMAACDECYQDTHIDHKISEGINTLEFATALIASELPKVLNIRNSLQKSIKPIEISKQQIEHQEDFLLSEVQTRFSRIHKELNNYEKLMKTQVQNISKSKQDILQKQLYLISQLQQRAHRLSELMSQSSSIPDESSLISIIHLFLKKCKQLSEDYNKAVSMSTGGTPSKAAVIRQQATLSPCEFADLSIVVPQDSVKKVLREQAKVYKVTVHPESCTATGPGLLNPQVLQLTYFSVQLRLASGKCCIQQQELHVEINTQSVEGKISEAPKISHKGQGKYIVSYCPRVVGTCVIRVAVNRVDIKGSPFNVIIYPVLPFAFNSKSFSSLHQLEHPSCIALDVTGEVVVTDQRGIVRLDRNAKEISRFNTTTSKDTCGGIAICNEQYIYVTSLKYHWLSKYSPLGRLDARVGQNGDKYSEFNAPTGIAIHPATQEIFVCDSLNYRIQVFNLNLSFQREISLDFTNKCLQFPSQPADITFQTENHLAFITDSINNCVLAITSNETLHCIFSTVKGPQKQLSNPRGITADNDGYLYVCDSGIYSIH